MLGGKLIEAGTGSRLKQSPKSRSPGFDELETRPVPPRRFKQLSPGSLKPIVSFVFGDPLLHYCVLLLPGDWKGGDVIENLATPTRLLDVVSKSEHAVAVKFAQVWFSHSLPSAGAAV
jgi:hypothetical protein